MLNPLSPNIHIQILRTGLYTFPLRISWESLIKDQGIFSLVIILLTLITFSLANVWKSLGENWCWSLFGLKGLRVWQMTSNLVLCHGQSLLGLLSHLLNWLSHFAPCKAFPWAISHTNQLLWISKFQKLHPVYSVEGLFIVIIVDSICLLFKPL